MAMERIYVTTPQIVLKGAHQGENLARCICFPIDRLKEQYGEGTWTIVFRRPFEADPYVVANQEEVGEYAVWGMDATDTAVAGEGRVELRYYVDDTLCKTDVYAVLILPSLGETGEAPSPYEDIIDTVAGYAAEARDAADEAGSVVSDAVAELQAELDEAISGVTVDSEVINARVDADGTTYGTLKARLDAENTELKNDITSITGNTRIAFILGKYIATNGATADVNTLSNNSTSAVAVVDCSEGDKFTINAQGGAVGKTWAFIASNGTVLSVVANNDPVSAVITAPENARYLVINDKNPVTGFSYIGELLVNTVEKIGDTVSDALTKKANGNLYTSSDAEKYTGYYYYRSGVNLAKAAYASYSCFIVPVLKNSVYSCSTSRINLLDEQKKPISTTGSWDFQDVDIFNSGSASYIAVSFDHTVIAEADYVLSFGTFLDASAFYNFYTLKNESNNRSVIAKNTTALTANGTVTIKGKSAVKDGMTIMFKGFLSAFGGIRLRFDGGASSNYIEVNATNLVVKADTETAQTTAHGMTITNDITLLARFIEGKVAITIESNGYIYKADEIAWYQTGGTITEHTILSLNGTTCLSSVFEVIYECAKRAVWYFGDSYMEFNSDARFPYYLIQYGYDKNALFSGASGCGSSVTYQALNTLRQYGLPKYAIFATGMNDGSDSSNAPSTAWQTALTTFISLCEALGIIPILCTIPTVPSVNNEQKNIYVKASGYRYIDYAKAVGAQSDGTWYAGMLSNDNIHPSEYGAKALFTQLLIDLPEIITN
jgi:hypothetical protein